MKKRVALLLGMVLAVSSLVAGCSNREYPADQNAGNANSEAVASTEDKAAGNETVAAEGALKTGLAMITSIGSSVDATAEAEGAGQADTMIAAVTVDGNGVIVDCVIDSAQTVVNFTTDGKITTDLAAEFKTKNELGPDYGMVAYGNATAEWNEQAAAFAAYCVGKTADEVTGMAVTEDGKAADEDLAASVTVHVGDFQAIVAKAAANATELGAQAGDKLGLGVITSVASSKDAAEEDGLAQVDTTVAVTTVNADGVITSAVIDSVQAKVNFDAAGKVTSDLAAEVQTKNELGPDYGMVAYGNATAEWNEQAAAFAAYCVGKTADEVTGMAVTEDGKAADEDLAASVTVHVGVFNNVITKAANNVK